MWPLPTVTLGVVDVCDLGFVPLRAGLLELPGVVWAASSFHIESYKWG